MSEIRQDPISGAWMIYAPDRENRPHTGTGKNCPFCPGNETLTPPEIVRYPEEEEDWLIRVVPNRYPVLSPQATGVFFQSPLYHWGRSSGCHEVIVEHCRHSLDFYDFSTGHIKKILQIYQLRMKALRQEGLVESVILFKNSGVSAGETISHSHSQILSLPFIPAQMIQELENFTSYAQGKKACLMCRLLEEELETGEYIIDENQHFITMAPFASPSPYRVWIVPRRHSSSFLQQIEEELHSLSAALTRVLFSMKNILKRPSFNLSISVLKETEDLYHWHLTLAPKMTITGGFEMASGVMVNPTDPRKAAERLKQGLAIL